MALSAGDSILICIDFQERLMPRIANAKFIIDRAALAIKAFKSLGVPIVVTEQYPKGLGMTVPELRALHDSEPIEKIHFNCFEEECFRRAVEGLGRRKLLMAGVETHICVAQTALEAIRRGFEVHILEDATSSRSELDREVGLKRMEGAGAIPSSVEMALYEILGKAGTPEFKEVLKLLK
ncbi:MAG: hydrolase [Candidatus Bathyarchaeia archaeon]